MTGIVMMVEKEKGLHTEVFMPGFYPARFLPSPSFTLPEAYNGLSSNTMFTR
ncbi:MAG TPA: hypothetical protein VF780_01160 [Nitrosospira sp.]